MFPALDLYYADPPQFLITAREQLDSLDYDMLGVWSNVFIPSTL